MAEQVRTLLEGEGGIFHLGTEIQQVRDLGREREVVVFRDGAGQETSAQGDALLVALGRSARVDGLGLENAGVDFHSKGIHADNRLRTSHKHIFACGDATGAYQFTHAAGYEGGIVVTNAVFHLPRKTDYTWMPACTYTDPEFASLGLNESPGPGNRVWNTRSGARPLPTMTANWQRRSARGGSSSCWIGRASPWGCRLSPHAGKLLSEWVTVLNARVKLSGMVGAIHPYPTLIV